MRHRVRELEHTADVGFEVRAPSLEGLFEGAARGLVDALGFEDGGGAEADGGAEAGTGEPEALRLFRPDLERLLVHWLRELLSRAMADGEVPEARVHEVRSGDGDEPSLRASVRWRSAAGAGPAREIKGVTYHGLEVARADGSWHARVLLDV